MSSLIRRMSLKLTSVSLFTAFLGAWWAFQEGSWGGWWNWDISEYFSLIILFFYTAILHSRRNNSNRVGCHLQLTLFLFTVLLLNIFVQYNLSNTSHSFGEDFTRGSILSRKQQLLCLSFISLLLMSVPIRRANRAWKSFKVVPIWFNNLHSQSLFGYSLWSQLFTLTLLYSTVRAFTKSTSTLMNMGGLSVFLYTFPWRIQVVTLASLLILLSWGWGISRGLLYVLCTHLPISTILLVMGNSHQTRWKIFLHVVLLTAFVLTPFYTPFVVLMQGVVSVPSNHLNFSLEIDYWVSSGLIFGTNFTELQTNFLRVASFTYVSTPFNESTTGETAPYLYYFAASYPEQRLCLHGLYTLWFVYELEVAAPLLAAAVSVTLLGLLHHLLGGIKITQ